MKMGSVDTLRRALLLVLLNVCLAAAAPVEMNILYINEAINTIANEALDSAIKYAKKTLDITVNDYRVVANGSDAKQIMESICLEYKKTIDEKKSDYLLVVDMTRTGVPSECVKSFTKALGLPTISGSFGQDGDLRYWRNLNEQTKYLIQIMPPADMITQFIRSFSSNQSVSNAGILFDDTFVMDHKYKSLLQNIPTRHIINEVKQDNITGQLQRFSSLEVYNYFILGRLSTIVKALNAGHDLKFFKNNYAWTGISLETGILDPACKDCEFVHVKPVRNPSSVEQMKLLKSEYGLTAKPEITAAFYFDIIIRGFAAIQNLVDKKMWPTMNYVTCDNFQNETLPSTDLKTEYEKADKAMQFSYAPLIISKNGNSFMQFSTSVQRTTFKEGKSQPMEIATWDAGLDTVIKVKNMEALVNSSAITLYRVVTLEQKPFIIRDGYDANGKEKFKGYCIDLMDEIKNISNFQYEIFHVKDGEAGNMDENGEWNGMIRTLMDKEADIALGSLSVMAERENVIDFTVPYYDLVGITILMRKPKSPTSLFKFLTVLENEVWLCILAAYFFTSFLMWVFDRWSPYSYQNNREKYKDDEEKREFNLKECLWFCMTSLTPQGGGEAPKNLSGRLVAATWWLFGFIIIASYTANLAAFLTVSRLDTPVESLDDLSKQYKIQYAPLANSSSFTYFKRMSDIETRFYEIWKDMSLNDSLSDVERAKLAVWDYPVSDKYTKILQAMTEAGFPVNITDALVKVRKSKASNEGFAFIGDATDIRYLELTTCDLQMVGEEFSRKPYALAVQQGSPLKDQFNNAILQLLNKRKLEKLKERWWNQNPEKKTDCDKQDDQSDGISIQNIGGVFIVIFVGIGLALITLAFEYFWYKIKRNPRVINVGPPPAATTVPAKMDGGLTMRGFRPRNFPDPNSRAHGVPLAGVTNPW